MSWSDMAVDFWHNMKVSAAILPHFYKEMDRKFNKMTKIRKLDENDPDLLQNLEGKVCVITGGTRGIGAEAVKVLLRKECYIITGSSAKTDEEIQRRYDEIRADVPEGKGKLEIWRLDLRSMESAIRFADKFKETKLPLNYFIANAGIGFQAIRWTQDKFEEHMSVNYLGHCLLIDRLIDNLYETSNTTKSESRIVMVSSFLHKLSKIRFNDLMLQNTRATHLFAYGQSKLAQIMFCARMAHWLKERGEDWEKSITINCLNPGICNTEIMSHLPTIEEIRPMAGQAFRAPKEGAETIIYATISTQMSGISGKYLEDCILEMPSKEALVTDDQNKLWTSTWKILDKWTEHYWI